MANPPLGSQTPRIAATRPKANPFTPPIPAPTTDVNNLQACVAALKAAMESLTGQRGDALNRAVLFRDLLDYNFGTTGSDSGGGGVQTITLTGDVTGAGTGVIPVTLASVNDTPGTFQGLTVNAKGLVTHAVQVLTSDTVYGMAKVDGTTITAVDGVISAVLGGGGGTPPTIVRSGASVGTTSAVALSAAPAQGNVLLAVGTHWTNNVPVSAGWTTILNTVGVATDGNLIAFKVAGAGESATQTPFGASGGGQSTGIWEIAGMGGPVTLVGNFQESAAATLVLNSFNNVSGLVLGAFSVQASGFDYTLTGATGTDFNVTGATPSNTPRRIKGFHVTGSAAPAAVTATLDAGHNSAGFMFFIPGS